MTSKLTGAGKKGLLGFAAMAALVAVFFVANEMVFAQDAGNIKHRLAGMSAKERANIKAAEIAKGNPIGVYQDATYGLRIEIQSISKIEGGVEIFARAWRGSAQLGFGEDGSVEWERFRIFNPPILVDDPAGDIVREWTDDAGVLKQRTLREDPIAATREHLAHSISVIGKGGTGIIKGKRGNTTYVFCPDAHTESTSVDGQVNRALIDSEP